MFDRIIQLFSDHTFQIVALGTSMLGILCGMMGTFITLRKESLLGDALSHAALPGIVIGFSLVQQKLTPFLLLGAAISGLLATGLIKFIHKKSVVKFDSALSLILSSTFGLGLVLLTYIQGSQNANQAGLQNFIFGQASAMLRSDIRTILYIGIIMIGVLIFYWNDFKVATFDPDFAQSALMNARWIELLMSTMIVVTIIIGLESVGVILISALLIGPSIAARQWSNHLSIVFILAAFFGLVSGLLGTLFSSLRGHIATGPTIVICISLIVLVSLFFAPKRGIIARWIDRRQKEKRIILKLKNTSESKDRKGHEGV